MRMSSRALNHGSERGLETPTSGLPFVVGFYFAFRIFIPLLSVRLLGTDPQAGAAASLALNFFFPALAAFWSPGEGQSSFAWMARLPTSRWVFIYLAVSACSLTWTAAASLPAAIAYWCAMFADVAMVLLFLRALPHIEVGHSLMKGYVWGASFVAVIAWMLPAQSDLRLGDEELLGPNQIGYLCAFAFFFAQYLMIRKDGRWSGPAFLLAVTILRSLSKTTITAFLVSESIFLLRDKAMSRRTKIALFLVAGLVVIAFWGLLVSYFQIYTSSESQTDSLTGRLGIWAYFLEESLQQPWIGHGFHSVWKIVPPFGSDQFEARHAHNELLQQFYAYGLAGFCIFAGFYTSFLLQIRRLGAGRVKTFLYALLVFVLVRGLADTEAFDLSLPLWAMIVIGAVVAKASEPSTETPAGLPALRLHRAPASKPFPFLK
jgi:exopolysaccharide production protein ExoQ